MKGEESLTGKKILYIGPKFFSYEKTIKDALENEKAKVYYYPDNPLNDFLNTNVMLKLNKLRIFLYKVYYTFMLVLIKNKDIDYFFIIKGDMVPEFFLDKIKNREKIKFIMYQWDSMARYPKIIEKMKYFDKVYTFELEDSLKYEKMVYLPFFYLPQYEKIKNENCDIDFLFIGSNHSDRIKILYDIEKIVKEYNLSYYFHIHNKFFSYLKQFLFNKDFKLMKKLGYTFKTLSQDEVFNYHKRSKIIIDIQAKGQKGPTLRILDSIVSNKKIISTNGSLREKDYYKEDSILIINREKVIIPKEFIDKNIETNKIERYENYNVKNWIKTIFIG